MRQGKFADERSTFYHCLTPDIRKHALSTDGSPSVPSLITPGPSSGTSVEEDMAVVANVFH